MRSTVVVVTWRGRDLVGPCLDALAAQHRRHRLLVVDNASTDGTAGVLAAHPAAPEVLRLGRNAGFAGGIAAALPLVDTEFVGWLNDDARPEPGWLAALEDALDAAPGAGAAASLLCIPEGSPEGGPEDGPEGEVRSAGTALDGRGYGRDHRVAGPDTDAGPEPAGFGFCGGGALLRTGLLRAVGGVPARFFCYYEDLDTSWRLRLAGWDVLTVPAARAGHAGGASSTPGSAPFHRWNERNRLLTLLRCAPAVVAAAELARFAGLTAALAVCPARRRAAPDAPNYRPGLRTRVLAEVLAALPATLGERLAIGRRCVVGRAVIWDRWAGTPHGGPVPPNRPA